MKKAVWAGIAVNFLLAAAINIIYFNQQINLLLIGVGQEENIKSPVWVFAIFILGTALALCVNHIRAQEIITDEETVYIEGGGGGGTGGGAGGGGAAPVTPSEPTTPDIIDIDEPDVPHRGGEDSVR